MAWMESLPLSSVLALCSAALFGFSINLVKKGLATLDGTTGTLISIYASTLLFWIFSPGFVARAYFSSPAVMIFGLVGLFRPVLTANISTRGTHRLGPTINQTVASTSPLFAVAGGIFWLREQATWPILLGTLAIFAGIAALSWKGKAPREWNKLALLLPVSTAALRALGHLLVKRGMVVLPSPFFAVMVGNSVSFVLGLLEFFVRGRFRNNEFSGWGTLWFLGAGLINGVSALSLTYALQAGQVVSVSPLVASSPLFTLLFSTFIFRQDRASLQTLVGIACIVPGVMLITLYR